MPLNVNKENLTAMYGSKAEDVFREIADLGGHGDVDFNYAGGLGILGALSEENTAISNQAKARIAELAQVDRKKEIDKHKGVGLPRTADVDTVNSK